MPSRQNRVIALVDESGSLPDPNDLVVVIAVVIAESTERNLGRLLARIRRRLPDKGKRKRERQVSELKFRTTSPKTRRQVLAALAEQNVALLVASVRKEGVGIRDTPENYAALANVILRECAKEFPNIALVLLDRHFSRQVEQESMSRLVREQFGREVEIRHVDSLQDPRIDLADFVAGAVAVAQVRGDTTYEDLIRGKLLVNKTVRWAEKEKW